MDRSGIANERTDQTVTSKEDEALDLGWEISWWRFLGKSLAEEEAGGGGFA